MTNRFMISVAAAALLAGTGFASAQGPGRDAPGSAVQQSAPAERAAPSAAPMNRDSATEKGAPAAKTTQSEQPQGGKNLRAQDDLKPGMKGEKSAQDNLKGDKSKSMSSETQDKGAAGKDMKAEGRDSNQKGLNAETKGAPDGRSQTTTQTQTNQKGMNAETRGPADSKSQTTTQSQSNQPQTTGQAGAAAKLSTEQRTQITTVIREQHVAPVANVNFSIAVGTHVPRSGVTFHPLPTQVVTIYPEWRGYEFILVNNQILVVNPRTLEIVAVLDV